MWLFQDLWLCGRRTRIQTLVALIPKPGVFLPHFAAASSGKVSIIVVSSLLWFVNSFPDRAGIPGMAKEIYILSIRKPLTSI